MSDFLFFCFHLLEYYLLFEFSQREALEEISSGVFEDARLNDEHAEDICLYYFHSNDLSIVVYT